MTVSVGKRLFEASDDIRSVMVVDRTGLIVEWMSRTKRPVAQEFVDGLARTWVGVTGGLVARLEDFFGESSFLHIRYSALDLYGFHYGGRYVIFSARIKGERDVVQRAITNLTAEGKAETAHGS